ncbi:hypothetical protein [Paracoccus ravus]|uniref:hypothetical protein n=1 Tax=Paracoccus ravus TaxID=2447760 RepID=UPI00106EA637|nr:hypothetical protein [Paracoccus ravus]
MPNDEAGLFPELPPRLEGTELVRRRNAEAQRQYRARPANAAKLAARLEVQRALAHGDLTRPEGCAECGVSCVPEAHHSDYARPQSVEWLCRACHMRRHRLPEALPGQMSLQLGERP